MSKTLIPTVRGLVDGREMFRGDLLDQEKTLWMKMAREGMSPERVPDSLELFYLSHIDGGLAEFLKNVVRHSRGAGSYARAFLTSDLVETGFDSVHDLIKAMQDVWGEFLLIQYEPWEDHGDEIGDEIHFQARGIHTALGVPIV